MHRVVLAASALALLSPTGVPAQDASPRIFYETLDLATPQAAADTFLSAYARSDFQTVYAVLSPGAQTGFFASIARTFDASELLPGGDADFMQSTAWGRDSDLWDEFARAQDLLFDNIMIAAQAAGILPFTVAPDYEVRVAAGSIDPPTMRASVKTQATPPLLELDLVRLPSGRWKVDRIGWPGSDPARRPWSIQPPAAAP